MNSAIALHGAEHCQIGSTVMPRQGRQKRPGCIAKSVDVHRQNGSTGLVSFYECDTEVSLEGPPACSGSQLSGGMVLVSQQTGGGK
jgi:hypothetical protein